MKTIFIMSLYASAMIIIIALTRSIFLKRFPKTVFKLLWLAAAVRMTVPLFLKIPVYVDVSYSYRPENYAARQNFIIPIIYAAGVISVSVFFTAAYIRGLKKYSGARAAHRRDLSIIADSFGIRRKIDFRISEKVCAPLTYGILRPKIICPPNIAEYEAVHIKYAVCHELVHVKRFDALYKLVMTAAVCIHWFNPFAWLMLALSEMDTELSCDEEVLKRLGGREDYALALLAFEEKRRTEVFTAFGQNAVKERIELIMKFKKTTAAAVSAAIAIALCTAAVFALSPEIRAKSDDGQQYETTAGSTFGNTSVITNENGGEIIVEYSGSSGVLSHSDSSSSYGVLSHSDSVDTTAVQSYENGIIGIEYSVTTQKNKAADRSRVYRDSDGVLRIADTTETAIAHTPNGSLKHSDGR